MCSGSETSIDNYCSERESLNIVLVACLFNHPLTYEAYRQFIALRGAGNHGYIADVSATGKAKGVTVNIWLSEWRDVSALVVGTENPMLKDVQDTFIGKCALCRDGSRQCHSRML